MASLIFFPLLIVVAAMGLVIFLIVSDAFTSPEILRFNSVMSMYGYATHTSQIERATQRFPILQRVYNNTNVARLLAVAGRPDDVRSFVAKALGYSLGWFGVAIVVDGLGFTLIGGWFFTPLLCFAVAGILFFLRISRVNTDAKKIRKDADNALGDILPMLAILTHRKGLSAEVAIPQLASCMRADGLERVLDRRNYIRLIPAPPQFDADLYRELGKEYDIPMFGEVGDAVRRIRLNGSPDLETFIDLAKMTYDTRLSESRAYMGRAKILITLPVAGMLIPLMLMIGAPTVSQIGSSLH